MTSNMPLNSLTDRSQAEVFNGPSGSHQAQQSRSSFISYFMQTTSSLTLGRDVHLASQLLHFVYRIHLNMLYLILSVYQHVLMNIRRMKLKVMMVTYYHNRTPQLIRQDVVKLPKIPGHIAVILQLKENEEGGGISGIMNQTGEIAAWCIGAGVQTLSVYERTGTLKRISSGSLHRAISKKLTSYYGESRPTFKINSTVSGSYANGDGNTDRHTLVINLLSEEDGRETIVDLTRTLAEMAVENKVKAQDLTVETIDAEMRQLLVDEPDLLILFTPHIDLQGFPPWPIRLSEIYHEPDNDDVSYAVFYSALQRYAGCKINVGR